MVIGRKAEVGGRLTRAIVFSSKLHRHQLHRPNKQSMVWPDRLKSGRWWIVVAKLDRHGLFIPNEYKRRPRLGGHGLDGFDGIQVEPGLAILGKKGHQSSAGDGTACSLVLREHSIPRHQTTLSVSSAATLASNAARFPTSICRQNDARRGIIDTFTASV